MTRQLSHSLTHKTLQLTPHKAKRGSSGTIFTSPPGLAGSYFLEHNSSFQLSVIYFFSTTAEMAFVLAKLICRLTLSASSSLQALFYRNRQQPQAPSLPYKTQYSRTERIKKKLFFDRLQLFNYEQPKGCLGHSFPSCSNPGFHPRLDFPLISLS